MTLLAPWLLAFGVAGAAALVFAHLRGRRRRRVVRFSAMRFVPAAAEPTTRRRRIDAPWLLAIRLLLAVLAAAAAAGPRRPAAGHLAVYATPHDAILVLDDSASTAARTAHGTVRQAVARRARALVAALPPGSRAGLAFVDPTQAPLEPTEDLGAVLDRIDAWAAATPRPVGGDLVAAARAALDLVPAAGERPVVLYPIGDATAGGVPSLAGWTAPGPVLPSVVEDPPPRSDQWWVEAVEASPDPALGPGAVRIVARLGRTQTTRDAPVPVILEVGGEPAGRAQVTFDGPTAEVGFAHVLDDPGTPVPATVRLDVDDALPDDDARTLWLQADAHIDVLVVDGAPSELRPHDEIFYLATALSVLDGDPPIEATVRTPAAFARRLADDPHLLDRTDVLVLANVPAPDRAIAEAIARAVDEGLGLWITAGDHVDPKAYGTVFGALLPLRLRDAKAAGTLPGRTQAKAARLGPPNLDDPLLAGLAGAAGLTNTTARRFLLFEPDPAAEARVALSFEDGAPALASAERGRGVVAILATTLDRDWTNLPLQPGFVGLCGAVLRNLATGRSAGARGPTLAAGTRRPLAGTPPFAVTAPDGTRRLVPPAPAGGTATFGDTWALGPYEVTDGGGRVVDRFAAVFPVSESDLTPHPSPPAPPGAEGVTDVARWTPMVGPLLDVAVWLLLFEALWRLVLLVRPGRRR